MLLVRYRTLARYISIVVLILALGIMAGWTLDVDFLKTGIAGSLPMNPVTALNFIFNYRRVGE